MKQLAVDFDAVLHHYTGWDGNPPKGKPVLGAVEALAAMKEAGFQIVVFSARESWAVSRFLEKHGMSAYVDAVTDRKPKKAVAFFDDRGVHVPANTPHGLHHAFRKWRDSTRNPDFSVLHAAAQSRLTK